MKIVDINAEILEAIWTFEERGPCSVENLKMRAHHSDYLIDDEMLSELERSGHITISNNETSLTEKGKNEARPIIRRHRLAERLLTDVLGMTPEETEESACEYEHVLAPGLTEAICTLLGHPRECPHGSPIPEGECCKRADVSIKTAVKSLDALDVGDMIKIAYIRTDDHVIINKLYSFGISPGKTIKIRQKFPTFVVQLDHSQIALEKNIAEYIYGLKN
jgi:DtxR family Mn-dependent transcriptional regulator